VRAAGFVFLHRYFRKQRYIFGPFFFTFYPNPIPMPANVNLLLTRADCVLAKEALEAELDGYQNRDQNDAYQDRREGRTEGSAAARLATVTGQVTYLQAQLARTDLSAAERVRNEGLLDSATYQQRRLNRRTTGGGGAPAYLGEVDNDQTDGQVAILTAAIAAAQTRHDALPA